MKLPNRILSILMLGFAGVLGLISVVVLLNLNTVASSNQRLEEIVHSSLRQSSLLTEMKDAIHRRQVLLRELFLIEDPFEFDAKRQQFGAAARDFIGAREQLQALEFDDGEHTEIDKMLSLVAMSQPLQDRAIALLAEGQRQNAAELLLTQGLSRQADVVHQIGFIVARQRQATRDALENTLLAYQDFRQFLIFTGLLLFAAGSSIAILVARRIHRMECELISSRREAESANQMLTQLAVKDSLTGLANRRFLDERLLDLWQRCSRSHTPLGVMMIDIDFFKSYNDTYGHQYGDEVIQRVAGVLKSTLRRDTDVVARYGGEEFIILLPDTPQGAMLTLARALQSRVIRLAIPSLHAEAPLEFLTVSIGCAHTVPTAARNSDDLVAMADKALYKAKTTGRNGIVIEDQVTARLVPALNQ